MPAPTLLVRSARRAVCLAALVLSVAGCGSAPRDNAVEAQEQNTVELGGVSYRAMLFRELNGTLSPDDTVLTGPPAGPDRGFYGLFLRVCNRSGQRRITTSDVHVEDAFGTVFPPRPILTADEVQYRPAPLESGECLPGDGTAAERLLDGAALVFAIPFDKLGARPFVLELRDRGETRRIQLDL